MTLDTFGSVMKNKLILKCKKHKKQAQKKKKTIKLLCICFLTKAEINGKINGKITGIYINKILKP